MRPLRVGLLVNPLAGSGGPMANKGSDNLSLANLLEPATQPLRALQRTEQFLAAVKDPQRLQWVASDGFMGGASLRALGIAYESLPEAMPRLSEAADTARAVAAFLRMGLDLLVIVGGDGTARDLCEALQEKAGALVVLGVPAGVKMHSGVYAVNPQAAAAVLSQMADGRWMNVDWAQVRDLDETALREGRLGTRYFGQLRVPLDAHFIQAVKQGGFEPDAHFVEDVAAFIAKTAQGQLLIMGPGAHLAEIKSALGITPTLLGVDVRLPDGAVRRDLTAVELLALLPLAPGSARLYLTVIGGQGHLIGRGNQQLTPEFLRGLGRENLFAVASREKLRSIEGRSLLMDSGDAALDALWQGLVPVICGYEDTLVYPLSATAALSSGENPV
jgi:predicted polyphosphate/ATP-dependent NAD kinase